VVFLQIILPSSQVKNILFSRIQNRDIPEDSKLYFIALKTQFKKSSYCLPFRLRVILFEQILQNLKQKIKSLIWSTKFFIDELFPE